VAREQLFVASKVAAEHKTYEEAMAGSDKTLETMGLDYVDLMIIHSPQPWDKVNQSDDLIPRQPGCMESLRRCLQGRQT
jgi:diketogulonate reductase-like aldo/keto reductase